MGALESFLQAEMDTGGMVGVTPIPPSIIKILYDLQWGHINENFKMGDIINHTEVFRSTGFRNTVDSAYSSHLRTGLKWPQ